MARQLHGCGQNAPCAGSVLSHRHHCRPRAGGAHTRGSTRCTSAHVSSGEPVAATRTAGLVGRQHEADPGHVKSPCHARTSWSREGKNSFEQKFLPCKTRNGTVGQAGSGGGQAGAGQFGGARVPSCRAGPGRRVRDRGALAGAARRQAG